MTPVEPTTTLFERLGVLPGYTHAGGWAVETPDSVRLRLAAAQGYAVDTDDDVARSLARLTAEDWHQGLPAAHVVVRPDDGSDAAALTEAAPLPVMLPAAASGDTLDLTLTREDGTTDQWQMNVADLTVLETASVDGVAMERRALYVAALPGALPLGYHRLRVRRHGHPDAADTTLIVAPARCWLPEAVAEGRRLWGLQVQLYGARSQHNWGLGTFTDLATLMREAARLGADTVAVNPLHALFPDQPRRRSPYSPSSRLWLNPLYIDPAQVPESRQVLDDWRHTPGHEDALHRLRAMDVVPYEHAAAQLWPLFRRLHAVFEEIHVSGDTERGRQFAAYCQRGGAALEGFARHQALAERFGPRPWFQWPDEFQHPDNPAVAHFADAQPEAIRFHMFLQFEADRQLCAAAHAAPGMTLGLYRDVAVGFDRDGADGWLYQEGLTHGVSVGAPPDLRNPVGQDWGVAVPTPRALTRWGYRPFIDLMRANMRHAGALRLDHAFQLIRLYWVPIGHSPEEGGYVAYPMDDLMAIIALESHRNQCLVVAEDLGTIPEGFRERIMGTDALSFRVLHRERAADRHYKAPDAYPDLSVVVAGTHDQGTFAGFWSGRDVASRRALDLYPTPEEGTRAAGDRSVDRDRLITALAEAGLWEPGTCPAGADGLPVEDLIVALHRFLARTPSRLLLVNLDDIVNQTEQINMPATVNAYPNWLRRIPLPMEDLDRSPRLARVAEAINTERRS